MAVTYLEYNNTLWNTIYNSFTKLCLYMWVLYVYSENIWIRFSVSLLIFDVANFAAKINCKNDWNDDDERRKQHSLGWVMWQWELEPTTYLLSKNFK